MSSIIQRALERKNHKKGRYSSSWELHLRAIGEVTCDMGSHSVTYHPIQVNAPHLTPAMLTGIGLLDLPTPEDGRLS